MRACRFDGAPTGVLVEQGTLQVFDLVFTPTYLSVIHHRLINLKSSI